MILPPGPFLDGASQVLRHHLGYGVCGQVPGPPSLTIQLSDRTTQTMSLELDVDDGQDAEMRPAIIIAYVDTVPTRQ